MRASLLPFLSLIGALAAPMHASAQAIPSSYRYIETDQEVGLSIGTASLAEGRFGFGPSGGTVYGAYWNLGLSGPLGFELVANMVDGSRNVIDPGRGEADRVVGSGDVLLGQLDGRLTFTLTGDRTWRGLAPYLAVGGGLSFDLAGAANDDAILLAEDRFDYGTSFLGTLSAGSRYTLTPRWSLKGAATFNLHRLDTPPGFSDPDRGFSNVEESEWSSGSVLSLSLGFRY